LIDRDELGAWLRLIGTPGVGRRAQRRLLAAFGGPQAVFDASPEARLAVVSPALAHALGTTPAGAAGQLDATWQWLQAAPPDAPRQVLTLADAAYPRTLLETPDPPLLLFASGDLSRLQAPSVAIVGSRHATAQGVENARAFARHLSERGLTVVSGLALGIDAAAHEGALPGPGGTVAVVGTGLDIVYPARHASLAARIERRGLVLSEYTLGMPSLSENFPQRNRIIAGLSLGTLVVEAALQSGSLITARMALESGREVFAIPGSIHAPQSRGCHRLIQQGAKLVETGDDIVEELGLDRGRAPLPAATTPTGAEADLRLTPADALLDAMGYDPVTVDALCARTGCGAAAVGARLLALELAGDVARLPGGLLQRRARG
jgi:DNA processing protein